VAAVLVGGLALVLSRGAGRHVDRGTVHFLGGATPALAPFIADRNPLFGAFLRRHFWRTVVFSPHFDDKTRWYPNGWVYDDAYQIYPGSTLALQHPDWILRDAAGSPLFIPYACANGTCAAYAADISNPAFRQHWISYAKIELGRGYRGVFVDDVNMEFRVSNGHEQKIAPIDSATHGPMTYDAWRSYMAGFMEEIRAALPHVEIVHNALWFADSPTRTADPYIRREIQAAEYINLERGVNDPALTGGSGPRSLTSFLKYIDDVHALGKGVVLDGNATDRRGQEYALASYFLISNGHDAVSAHGMTPSHWWSGLDVNLGEALGPRERWGGVLRRDFTRGTSLVNEPGSLNRLIRLPSPMRNMDGQIVESVLLGPASGVVLRRQ
jgi:hypothetical protein